jgi:hypothetical protein
MKLIDTLTLIALGLGLLMTYGLILDYLITIYLRKRTRP